MSGDNKTNEEEQSKPQGGKKKLIIIIAVVLLLVGGGAGAYFAGIFGGGHEDGTAGEAVAPEHEEEVHEEAKSEEHGEAAPESEHGGGGEKNASPYVDMPDILVNLSTNTDQTSFIKMKVSLELADPEQRKIVDERMPILQDIFNTYLRDLRVADLGGSAGIYRLREELLARANKALAPAQVTNIYFREIMVQ